MNKLRGYRVMCGYSQSEMAEMLGMNRRTYLKRENDLDFSVKDANAIVDILKKKKPDITYDDIFLD